MSIGSVASRQLIRPHVRLFSSTAIASTASHAYHIPHVPTAGPSRPPPPPRPTRATTERPNLTPEEQQVIDRIVRVDQAGEVGANWIYRGQKVGMGIRGDRKAVKQIDVSCSPRSGSRWDRLGTDMTIGDVGDGETSLERHVDAKNAVPSPTDIAIPTLASYGFRAGSRNGSDGTRGRYGMYRGSGDSHRRALR